MARILKKVVISESNETRIDRGVSDALPIKQIKTDAKTLLILTLGQKNKINMTTNFEDKKDISIRDIQDFHRSLDKEKHFDTDIIRNIAYLTAEVGETMNAIRTLNKANTVPEIEEAKKQLSFELADCLAYIAKLANYVDVDLQEAYKIKMEINTSRNWKGRK